MDQKLVLDLVPMKPHLRYLGPTGNKALYAGYVSSAGDYALKFPLHTTEEVLSQSHLFYKHMETMLE